MDLIRGVVFLQVTENKGDYLSCGAVCMVFGLVFVHGLDVLQVLRVNNFTVSGVSESETPESNSQFSLENDHWWKLFVFSVLLCGFVFLPSLVFKQV